jgi:hypothetical protein
MINRMLRETSRSALRYLAAPAHKPCELLKDAEARNFTASKKFMYVHIGDRIQAMMKRWHHGHPFTLDQAIRTRALREMKRRGMRQM